MTFPTQLLTDSLSHSRAIERVHVNSSKPVGRAHAMGRQVADIGERQGLVEGRVVTERRGSQRRQELLGDDQSPPLRERLVCRRVFIEKRCAYVERLCKDL